MTKRVWIQNQVTSAVLFAAAQRFVGALVEQFGKWVRPTPVAEVADTSKWSNMIEGFDNHFQPGFTTGFEHGAW